MAGILQQTALSVTISEMNINAPLDHTLVRFKILLWFELTELHDKIFYQQQEFPQACMSTSIHPIHYLPKPEAAKNNYVLIYDLWVLSWIGLCITSEQVLGSLYIQ